MTLQSTWARGVGGLNAGSRPSALPSALDGMNHVCNKSSGFRRPATGTTLHRRASASAAMATGAAAPGHAGDQFFLACFASRQWDDPKYSGTRISYNKQEFVEK
eukprot:363670-Chlamydomonas_euryale.AAC.20